MNEQIKEATNSRFRFLASSASSLPQSASVRGVVATWRKATARRTCDAWAERDQERRHISSATHHGCPRMDEPQQPSRRRTGTHRASPADSDPARFAARLQPVRLRPLPARLRPEENRRQAGMLSDNRLHGRRRGSGKRPYGSDPRPLATCQKNANAIPATGQRTSKTSRHGTNAITQVRRITPFVPPRDNPPCFQGQHRPATGHLYRFTIYPGDAEERN